MIKSIIFDFDGIILESVDAKTQAFKRLFEDYPDRIEDIVQVHLNNGGLSRFVKFEMVYKDILKTPLSEEKSQELGRLFSEYCYSNVLKAPYVQGAQEYLDAYHDQLMMFVVSGTPEEEVRDTVKQRHMEKYFKEVYGSPRKKGELTKLILSQYSLDADSTVFVGDSINDFDGAQEAGVHFIGRIYENERNPFQDRGVTHLIKDLTGLEGAIEKLCQINT